MLLAFIIHVFHCFIVLFMIIVPFIPTLPICYLLLHAVGGFSLLIHWWANNDACSLTMMESVLRGIPKEEALTHKFISPLYTGLSGNTWSNMIHVITIALVLYSIYKLVNNNKCASVYRSIVNSKSDENLTGRIKEYFEMCKPLFLI